MQNSFAHTGSKSSLQEYLELSFFKENEPSRIFCSKYFDDSKNPGFCEGCGHPREEHARLPDRYMQPWSQSGKQWRADINRVHCPRKFGIAPTHEIEFIDEIEQLQKKAKLSILAVDNHPNIFIETLVDKWALGKPDIVISVTGSLKHLNIKKDAFHAFQQGLVKVVSKTKCWILSGGTNEGSDLLVSDALKDMQYLKWLGKNQLQFDLIGITNWNCVQENRLMSNYWINDSMSYPCGTLKTRHVWKRSILGTRHSKRQGSYREPSESFKPPPYKYTMKRKRATISSKVLPEVSKRFPEILDRYQTQLNPFHTYFLAIESGIMHEHEELPARTAIENFCAKTLDSTLDDKVSFNFKVLSTPTVLLVIGGDCRVLEHVGVSLEHSIPVILCQGTGGAADYLIKLFQKIPDTHGANFSYEQQAEIRQVLSDLCRKKKPGEIFPLGQIESASMEPWVFKCLRHRSNVSVYKMVSIDRFHSERLDSCIFSALLKGNTAKMHDPVRLSLKWNFCGDIDRTLLRKGTDINNRGDIELLMTEALIAPEKMPFAKLFLELGFAMNKYLTPQRLSQLYATSFRNCMYFRDVCFWVKDQRSKQSLRLKDVYDICYYFTSSRLLHKLQSDDSFVDPFRELFIWAVLSGHTGAAKFFWQYASNQLILALIGAELWKAVNSFLSEDDCKLSPKFQEARKIFLGKSYQVLQTAWETDPKEAGKLISKKLETFGNKSVMDVAWFTKAKEFIGHPCFELVVQKQWTNGLRCHHRRVLVALVYPVSILHLNYTFSDASSVQPFHKIGSIPWHELKNRSVEENELEKGLEKFLHTNNTYQSLGTMEPQSKFQPVPSFDSFDDITSSENQPETQLGFTYPSLLLYWNVWSRKAKLFYTSPSCKFFIHFIFHVIFVIAMSSFYLFHLRTDSHQPMEYYIAVHFAAVLAENLLGMFETDAYTINMKVKMWCHSEWNVIDMVFSTIALIAFGIPFLTIGAHNVFIENGENFRKTAYAVCTLSTWIKTLRFYIYDKKLGTKWIMIRKMLKEMLIFMSILSLFLCAFGIYVRTLTTAFDYEDAYSGGVAWLILRPFFILNGEFFIEKLKEAEDSGDDEKRRKLDMMTTLYLTCIICILFIGSAMLFNILIAIFGRIYSGVMKKSDEEWKSEVFTMLKDFQKRSFLPPPFSIIISFYRFVVFLFTWPCGRCKLQRAKGVPKYSTTYQLDSNQKFESFVVQKMLRKNFETHTSEDILVQTLNRKDVIMEKMNIVSGSMNKFKNSRSHGQSVN